MGGGGGRKLKKRLKMLIKRWKEQKQVTIYTSKSYFGILPELTFQRKRQPAKCTVNQN